MGYVVPADSLSCPYTVRIIPPVGLRRGASLSGTYGMGVTLAAPANVTVVDQGSQGFRLTPGGVPPGLSPWAVFTIAFPANAADRAVALGLGLLALSTVVGILAVMGYVARRRRRGSA